MSDGGKGSARRPGDNFEHGWERIFGKKSQPDSKDQPKQDESKDKPAERQK